MAKLCVALDLPPDDAMDLVKKVRHFPLIMKVGPSLLIEGGKDVVREILSMGLEVFLDLKLHDIPNTVARAVESAERLGVQYLTLHTLGGREMVRRAAESRESVKLIGVTLLTSHDEEYISFLGSKGGTISQMVIKLAGIAEEFGLDGVVCSSKEVRLIKARFSLLTVVPGIRLEASREDQVRVSTPGEARREGADIIVMGREIIRSPDPAKMVEKVINEIAYSQ